MMRTRTVTADRVSVGMHVIAPGRKRPVEIFAQLPAAENELAFAAFSTNGTCVLRLHHSDTVEVVQHAR